MSLNGKLFSHFSNFCKVENLKKIEIENFTRYKATFFYLKDFNK